ncbi:BA14K family protein [uncultured Devosia sp.]|uniref:BA14K family protein n=1 Tax=uncultured Devosia sp. TaxID=211434 RepID=UPI0035CB3401
MNILRNGLTALALVGTMAISGAAPAQAQDPIAYGQRDRVITSYCNSNRGDSDCRRYNRGGWRDRDYNNFYNSRRGNLDSIATGLFGFGFGAIVGGAIANSNNNNYNGDRLVGGGSSHVQACFNRYRSYDQGTDTFLGFDGVRRRCNL